ncbi:galanin receptor 2b-like [Diadema antillarum]|uniref:galanin receptor 2b-like n=1 Tax=Diadema antillarum TaxID=105358 RepID=UPI003A860DA4
MTGSLEPAFDTFKNATAIGTDTEGDDDLAGWAVNRIDNSAIVRTIYGLISFTGMTGNALVCLVLLRVPSLRTRTSQFIIHLAVTDFMTSFWVIPFHLFPSTPPIPGGFAGELMCRFYVSKYMLWVTVFASVYSLVSVTMERFFAIVYPIKYKVTFSLRYSLVIMVGCWLVGAISNSFFFYVYDYDGEGCQFVPYPTTYLQKVIGVYIFMLIYFIPITLNLVCHAKMIKTLRAQANSLDGHMETGRGNMQSEKWQLKVVQDVQRMLFVVVVTFMLCWAPNQIMFLAFNLGANVDFTKPPYHFSVILALCNSCMNPFIYVFKNRDFRKGVLKALGCAKVGRSSARWMANRVAPAVERRKADARETPAEVADSANGHTSAPTCDPTASTYVT